MFQFLFPHNIHRQFVGDLKTHKVFSYFPASLNFRPRSSNLHKLN